MSFDRLVAISGLTREQQHVTSLAFGQVLRKLQLVDRNDPVCEMIARKVIAINASGVTNAVAICEIAYRDLRP